MRHARKLFVAPVLVVVLSSSTFAGVLLVDVYQPPPDQAGIMQTGDALAQTVLTVLLSVLH